MAKIWQKKLHRKHGQFEGQFNVIVGQGECVCVGENMWRTPFGNVVTDKKEAISIATYINELYEANIKRLQKENLTKKPSHEYKKYFQF